MQLIVSNATFKASRKFAVTVTHTFSPGVTVVTGANGSGKSTLLRGLATVERPSGGSVSLNEVRYQPSTLRSVRQNLGYAPQHFALGGSETPRTYLRYSCWLKQLPRATWDSEIVRVLTAVQLETRAKERFRALSGGMRRRLNVAQSLLGSPRLLILDEPNAGLDQESKQQLAELLDAIGGTTCIIMASHSHEDLVYEAWDRLALS